MQTTRCTIAVVLLAAGAWPALGQEPAERVQPALSPNEAALARIERLGLNEAAIWARPAWWVSSMTWPGSSTSTRPARAGAACSWN